MIDAIVSFLLGIVEWLLGFLPTADNLSVPDWSGFLLYANQFINMPLLMSMVGLFLAYELSILTFRLVLWVWNTLKP